MDEPSFEVAPKSQMAYTDYGGSQFPMKFDTNPLNKPVFMK